jgi:MIP family channel proteins
VEASRPDDRDDDVTKDDDDVRTSGSVADEAAEVEAAAAVGREEIPERGPAAYLAEFVGTFGLVFFITMAGSQLLAAPLSEQEIAQGAQQPFVDLSVIGLVHLLALFLFIQTLAVVSGAHFNPAVTAALTAIRQIRVIDAAIYIVVQLAGGVLGALVTKLILKEDNVPNAEAVNWAAPAVSDALDGSVGLGMLVEGIGTFFLVWAIVGVAVHPGGLRAWAGLVIGGTLGLAFMVGGLLTGGSYNPARAFGPSLAAGDFFGGAGDFLLVYVAAPLIGALLAAFIYMQMFVLPGKKGPFGMGPVG